MRKAVLNLPLNSQGLKPKSIRSPLKVQVFARHTWGIPIFMIKGLVQGRSSLGVSL
jgi:hypothetical protein